MKAVENGDMRTAQKMVREEATKAGYNTPQLYHGTPAFGFTVFRDNNYQTPFIYTSTDRTVSAHYAGDNHYASARAINRKYDGGSSIASIIKDAESVFGAKLHVATEAEKEQSIKETREEAIKVADELDARHTDLDLDWDTDEGQRIGNAIAWVEDLFWLER